MAEQIYPDDAHRMSDAYNLARAADPKGSVGKWMAFQLADGSTDNVLYDTRADAVRHQFHETTACYVKVFPGGMTPEMAQIYLRFYRAAYDAGARITDPEQPGFIMPLANEQVSNQLRMFAKRGN